MSFSWSYTCAPSSLNGNLVPFVALFLLSLWCSFAPLVTAIVCFGTTRKIVRLKNLKRFQLHRSGSPSTCTRNINWSLGGAVKFLVVLIKGWLFLARIWVIFGLFWSHLVNFQLIFGQILTYSRLFFGRFALILIHFALFYLFFELFYITFCPFLLLLHFGIFLTQFHGIFT